MRLNPGQVQKCVFIRTSHNGPSITNTPSPGGLMLPRAHLFPIAALFHGHPKLLVKCKPASNFPLPTLTKAGSYGLLLLIHVRWQVVTSIVNVNKCAIHNWHRLQHVLKTLAVSVGQLKIHGRMDTAFNSPEIMAILQRRARIQHNINFHIQFVTSVVRL